MNRRHWTRYCRLTAACKIIIILLFPVEVEYEKYSANEFLKRTDLVHFWIEWYRFDYHCGFVLRRRLFWNQESPLNLSNWGCLEQLWLLQNWNWSKLFMNLHLNLHFILSTVYTRLHRLEFRPTWVVKSSNKSLNFELRWITFDGELRLITSAARTRMSVHYIFFAPCWSWSTSRSLQKHSAQCTALYMSNLLTTAKQHLSLQFFSFSGCWQI